MLNYLGFNIALLSVLLFIYVILGSIATKYASPKICAIYGAAYLSGFFLENIVY